MVAKEKVKNQEKNTQKRVQPSDISKRETNCAEKHTPNSAKETEGVESEESHRIPQTPTAILAPTR